MRARALEITTIATTSTKHVAIATHTYHALSSQFSRSCMN